MSDRRVHATGDVVELVRYERAGKWWVEPRKDAKSDRYLIPKSRVPVSLEQAVSVAIKLEGNGGVVHTGVSGGKRFDSAFFKTREGRS